MFNNEKYFQDNRLFFVFCCTFENTSKKNSIGFYKNHKKNLTYIYIYSFFLKIFFYHFNYPIFLTNKGSLIEIFCFVE